MKGSSRRQSSIGGGSRPVSSQDNGSNLLGNVEGSARKKRAYADEISDDEDSIVPITKATLSLRHDGNVYTAPACMVGVPVEIIDSTHPYWDPEWEDVLPIIREQLAGWEKKLEEVVSDKKPDEAVVDAQQAKNAAVTKRSLINRQVNRGTRVVNYFSSGRAVLSPYQLLAKKYINKSLIQFDTIYRMVQVLEEIPDFKGVDVTPLEWLRERLWQVIQEVGEDKFSLSSVMRSMYSDKKLCALRVQSGFRHVGRPPNSSKKPKGTPAAPERATADDLATQPETPTKAPTRSANGPVDKEGGQGNVASSRPPSRRSLRQRSRSRSRPSTGVEGPGVNGGAAQKRSAKGTPGKATKKFDMADEGGKTSEQTLSQQIDAHVLPQKYIDLVNSIPPIEEAMRHLEPLHKAYWDGERAKEEAAQQKRREAMAREAAERALDPDIDDSRDPTVAADIAFALKDKLEKERLERLEKEKLERSRPMSRGRSSHVRREPKVAKATGQTGGSRQTATTDATGSENNPAISFDRDNGNADGAEERGRSLRRRRPSMAAQVAAEEAAAEAAAEAAEEDRGRAKRNSSHRRKSGRSQPRVPGWVRGASKKRRKTGDNGSDDDITNYTGWSDRDSYTRSRVERIDYRVLQVKTQHRTTNAGIAQYWHWCGPPEHFFEHQVLEDVKPIRWGVYSENFNFHLRLDEIKEIHWAPDPGGSPKIMAVTREIVNEKAPHHHNNKEEEIQHLVDPSVPVPWNKYVDIGDWACVPRTKWYKESVKNATDGKDRAADATDTDKNEWPTIRGRGNVLAQFKRHRTAMRFLRLCRDTLSVKVVKVTL